MPEVETVRRSWLEPAGSRLEPGAARAKAGRITYACDRTMLFTVLWLLQPRWQEWACVLKVYQTHLH